MLKRYSVPIFLGIIISVTGSANTNDNNGKNVALGKTIAAYGEFFTGGWGAGLSVDFGTLADNVFFPTWHQFDQGPIWWDENTDGVQNQLHVFLGGSYEVNKLIIQVDNNDDYLVSWEDRRGGIQEVKVIPERNWGMAPRIVLKVNAITDRFTIEHDINGAGDGFYSVSEFQAIGRKHEIDESKI